MKLNFVVPGFSKCGTTTLCSLLNEHPEVFIPKEKEPAFFAYNYTKGWKWYEESFWSAKPEQMCGEGSTFYTAEEFAEVACQRMLDAYPDLKFIFLARDPIKRLESSFREMHHSGYKYDIQAAYSIGDCLRNLPNMMADTMYWQRLNVYRDNVPDNRIHTVFLEDLKANPMREIRKCFEFLNINPDAVTSVSNCRLNSASDKLYDSLLYRRIINGETSRRVWNTLAPLPQRILTSALRLKRPFRKPVEWDPRDKRWVLDEVADDARKFLSWAGKPADFWPSLAVAQDVRDAA